LQHPQFPFSLTEMLMVFFVFLPKKEEKEIRLQLLAFDEHPMTSSLTNWLIGTVMFKQFFWFIFRQVILEPHTLSYVEKI